MRGANLNSSQRDAGNCIVSLDLAIYVKSGEAGSSCPLGAVFNQPATNALWKIGNYHNTADYRQMCLLNGHRLVKHASGAEY